MKQTFLWFYLCCGVNLYADCVTSSAKLDRVKELATAAQIGFVNVTLITDPSVFGETVRLETKTRGWQVDVGEKNCDLQSWIQLPAGQKSFIDPTSAPDLKCPELPARIMASHFGKALLSQTVAGAPTYLVTTSVERSQSRRYPVAWELGPMDFIVSAQTQTGLRTLAIRLGDDCELSYGVVLP